MVFPVVQLCGITTGIPHDIFVRVEGQKISLIFTFPPPKKNSRKFLPTIRFDLSWTYSQPKVTCVAFFVCALNVFEKKN